jgi:hypothetical protein
MIIRYFLLWALLLVCHCAQAQIDSSLLRSPEAPDTERRSLDMDAVYNRPFLKLGKLPVSIGGYVEANWQYVSTSGISVGNQFQFRRFSLFVASTISSRIKFLSEIEFENDPVSDPDQAKTGPEFEIEYAAMDVELHPLFTLRGGIIVNPIGAFNQNHDGPKWEFVDRPIAMNQMLPDTWSTPGFGAYGKQYLGHWMFGYEFYVSGGFDDSIIDNAEGKTYLPAAKANPNRFSSSVSGKPLYTGKLSLGHDKIGELGLSCMTGVYNTWQVEGAVVDAKRNVAVYNADFNTVLPALHTHIVTEWAWVHVDVPSGYTPQYASNQFGGFVDLVQPVFRGRILDWDHATINLALRAEYVDWNVGNFPGTHINMYNDVWSFMPGFSFRPTPQTVFRFNYRRQTQRDITGSTIGATIGTTAGLYAGFATYF